MTEKAERLRVVTTGGVLAGFDRAKVVVEFAKLARQPEAVVEQLLAGARHVVKRNVDHWTATVYLQRFREIGVACAVEPDHLDPLEPLPAAARTAPQKDDPQPQSSPGRLRVLWRRLRGIRS